MGRGGCARMLIEEIGSRHLNLEGLSVPTLVIGSERDRLTPISQARKLAKTAPNVVDLVELPGGHCSMLEHPDEVNKQLRTLAEGAIERQTRASLISS
jgi:pimeloyl-ACP methyl ester carboxylesterase